MSGHARHLHAVPTLDPLDVLEDQLRSAIDHGAQDLIEQYGGQLDHIEASNTRPAPSLAGAALWYAAHGMPVFPLKAGGKFPAIANPHPDDHERAACAGKTECGRDGHGVKDATTNPEQIHAWWARMPYANIGLATGHLVDVVDIDGPTGQTTMRDLADRFATLNVVAKVSTPRPGGLHLYVPARPGMGNKTGWPGPGVDYRGRGGYVVAPPSRRLDGTYRFLGAFNPGPGPNPPTAAAAGAHIARGGAGDCCLNCGRVAINLPIKHDCIGR